MTVTVTPTTGRPSTANAFDGPNVASINKALDNTGIGKNMTIEVMRAISLRVGATQPPALVRQGGGGTGGAPSPKPGGR